MSRAAWDRAVLALRLLAVDPSGLGGLVLRARMGPVRQRFVDAMADLPLPARRLHPGIGDEQLFGGVDIAGTLAAGHVVEAQGLLAQPATLLLTMAERCPLHLSARLAQALDANTGHCLIALDEGAEPEEAAPAVLSERLAFAVDLDGVTLDDATGFDLAGTTDARHRLASTTCPPEAAKALTVLSARFGIDSLRAPLLAIRAARAHAALAARDEVDDVDIEAAAALVFPSRATQHPAPPPEEEAEEEQTPPPPDPGEGDSETQPGEGIPEEMLVDAVAALLPPNLLDMLAARQAARQATGSAGAGAKRKGNRRGRPLPSRPGRLDGTARIDLVATLRAAAPWQPLRRAAHPERTGLAIRSSDIRLRQFEEKSDRLLIFAVDASGSAALSRLNEAKGAVEILLAEAYARRDHVALIAFRGESAELLLPPTRSLVQTKRRLSALPGGGGTPLAAGLRAAMELAGQSRGRGLTPTVAVLTDGRANIALDGQANRSAAAEDASQMARVLRGQAIPGLVIDMANRPQRPLAELAAQMDAPYLPLPRADARRLSASIGTALAE